MYYHGTGAQISKIQKKDQILSIDNNKLSEVYYYSDFISISNGEEDSECLVKLKRNKDTLSSQESTEKESSDLNLIPIPNNEAEKTINDYTKAIKLFDLIYPDSISNSQITEYGIRYMLEQLDPHSTYISLKDIHDMNAPLKGSFTGVGIRFQIFRDTVLNCPSYSRWTL